MSGAPEEARNRPNIAPNRTRNGPKIGPKSASNRTRNGVRGRRWNGRHFLGSPGAVLGRPGASLGLSWGVLGPSWGSVEASWSHLGTILGRLGLSCAVLGRLGAVWEPFRGPLGAVLEQSWAVVGRRRCVDLRKCRCTKEHRKNQRTSIKCASSGLRLGPSWGALGALLGRLGLSGASLRRPQAVWGHLGAVWGPPWPA